ncbi:MAG: uroporphyrinogen decarboxylase family protein [Thermoproteota archaeon]
MNSWERVVRAMQVSKPDRVPTYEMAIPPAIASKILNKPTDSILLHNTEALYSLMARGEFDPEKINRLLASELLQLHRSTGIDWIRVIHAYSAKPREIRMEGEHEWVIDGRRYRWSAGSIWDLDEPKTYNPESIVKHCRNAKPEVNPKIFDILRMLKKEVKGEYFLSFDADGTWGPIVSNPNLLRHVLVWVYTHPEAVEALIDFNTKHAIEVGKWAIDEGADAIQLCVDYGHKTGPWLSPEMFRRFVKPALKRHCDAFKSKGAFVVLHSDGNTTPILQDMVDAGISAYQCIDVTAGMSLKHVKERYGDRICLVGNVDPRILEFGSAGDVYQEVNRCIRDGAPGGGYVLSASASVCSNTNAENFLFMLELAKRLGAYS